MKMFFLFILCAYLGGNLYIFVRALNQISHLRQIFLCSSTQMFIIKGLFSLLFWFCAVSLITFLFTMNVKYPSIVANTMYKTGSAWLVFVLYMVIFMLATDLVRLFVPACRDFLGRYGFLCVLACTLGVLTYGYHTYLHPQINRFRIDFNINPTDSLNKPSGYTEKLKIVAVSDIHAGYRTGKKQLAKYVDMINRENADVVFIVGDLIDNSLQPLYDKKMYEELAQLQAREGIYMVLGNHEYISGVDEVIKFLKYTNIQLLRDTVVTLPCGLQIIGRDDRSNKERKSVEELIEQAQATTANAVLLDHQPYAIAQKDSLGIALQLSGHTHYGQVWPMNVLTNRIYEQSHGYRKWKNSHVYVSSGLALWGPPFRIGTKSDMAVIELSLK